MRFTEIRSLELQTENIDYLQAEEDFEEHTRAYNSTIHAELRLFVNGEEVEHSNKLPAEIELVDTVRAQIEMLKEVKENGEYSDVPFCCTCGVRSCFYIQWDIETEDNQLLLIMEDLVGNKVGRHRYIVSFEVLRDAVTEILHETVEFMESKDIENLGWRDEEAHESKNYATLDEFREYREELKDL